MRALLVAALVGLAGCPSTGDGCPVDTISSASQCVPIQDLAIPDLSTAECPFDAPIDKPDGRPCSPNGAYCLARVDEETCVCTNLVWSCQSHFPSPDLGPTRD